MGSIGVPLLQLGQNVSLLLTAVIAYAWLLRRGGLPLSIPAQALLGMIYGTAILLGMAVPVQVADGIIFDGRNVLLALAGPFGGPVAAVVAATVAALARLWIGGAGTLTGLVNIVLAAAIGVAVARRFTPLRPRHLFGLGAAAALGLLVSYLFLPPAAWADPGVRAAMLPFALVVFVGIVGLGLLLRREDESRRMEHALAQEGAALRAERERLWLAFQEVRSAREAAEASSRSKSDFLAQMSHELRTPLNAILGFSEIIRDGLLGADGNPIYRDYARDIHASGQHLLGLVNDILDYARLERRGIELSESAFDLGPCLAEAVAIAEGEAAAYGVHITLEAGPAISLYADRRAVQRMMLNLLSNAAKFSPQGADVRLMAKADADGVAITVADSGAGIPPEDLERVLLPFERGAPPAQAARSGTGLGLALVKALAEAHEGSLKLTSTPGHGTQATLYFPTERVQAATVENVELSVL